MIRLSAVILHATLTFFESLTLLNSSMQCNDRHGIHLKIKKFTFRTFFGLAPRYIALYSIHTFFGCPCMVARVVARKKFHVLGLSGVLH